MNPPPALGTTTYQWQRFWFPRGSRLHFDPSGFPADPRSEFGPASNPDFKTLDELESIRCLVLLGEPGLGKTTASRTAYEQLGAGLDNHVGVAKWLDLADIADPNLLHRRLFDSDWFKAWKDGQHTLHLFLDSFDECLLDLRRLANVLLAALEACPAERLRLRLACRSAEWPTASEGRLQALWGEGSPAVFELVPLFEADVASAATAEGIEGAVFVCEIIRRDLVGIASVPLTLNLLLREYRQSGTFAGSRRELMHNGCLSLCTEHNESRLRSGALGRLTPHQRLTVASRVAAMVVLCGRTGITAQSSAAAQG